MKKLITALSAFVLPSFLAKMMLNLLGHHIHASAKIGFSWIWCNDVRLAEKSIIGHLNFIRVDSLTLGKSASIGSRNKFNGPFNVIIGDKGRISTSNGFGRAAFPISYGSAALNLGNYAIITHKHRIDMTRSVSLGDYSIIAGAESQLWTHGYYHAHHGLERIRVDGEIKIGDNVYVGSRCIFNPGVTIHNSVHIGAGACVSKDIVEPGMYVSQPLRFVDNSMEAVQSKLQRVAIEGLADIVYSKHEKPVE